MKAFTNEPILELRRSAERERLTTALVELDARLPLAAPVLIGGEGGSADGLVSTDPGAPGRVVAIAGKATPADARAAVVAARRGLLDWGSRNAADRAAVLVAAADALRRRRLELAALILREAGKPWAEADADVCEAIDFLEYYARGAIELDANPPLLQVAGERNEMRYVARGVVAVIAPWNFPLAIPLGMTAAALAVGNAVVLKPAEQAPGCSAVFVEELHRAGVPVDALGFLPGLGDVGAALVRDRGVAAIAFTGSGAVGLEILRSAAELAPGQTNVKRVIAEMGGKNTVIVDSDADLDDAIPAIVRSAFAYAGQKCSAVSRVLAHEAIVPVLLERLAGAVEVLQVGQAENFATEVPPVIEQEAQERVARYGTEGAAAGRVVARCEAPEGAGWFCAPIVLTDLPGDAPVLREEVFGPLLTVEPVASIDAALEVIDSLPFALTGGLFSRDPRTVQKVIAATPVGNLYVNRTITGAMVGRQPFGGNRLSGTGTKAGGPGYLLEFVEPRVVCENTMRHGIVV